MSITNSITKLLNFKEDNLIFNEDFFEERQIKGIRCFVIKAYLFNNFEFCPKCGCINDGCIIKKGCKKSLIKINKISEMTSYLELSKQYYKCKNCKHKIVSQSNIINFRCRISNNVKLAIFNLSKEIISKSFIARQYNVSDNTVQAVFDKQFYKNAIYKDYLPKAICIDEFTYQKGVMAFVMCNAKNGKTIDLVEDRSTYNLNKYFSYYSEKARKNVKFVVMDMYSPYIELIKKWFPNARIIIDLFHVVQLLTKRFNKTRIEVMKVDKKDKNKYKKYWRSLLKSRFNLNGNTWKKYPCFNSYTTEVDIVDNLLKKDKIFENSYDLYQDILYSLQSRNYNTFREIINKEYNNISSEMNTLIKSLRKFSKYIKNTLAFPYSNGVIERNNNTCKLLKRISFGYRSFRNMASRVFITTTIFRKKKREYHTEYGIPHYS